MAYIFNYNLPPETLNLISKRKAILFDISIWNRLADKKTNESIDVCNLLTNKVNMGKIFCPVSAPTVWELQKQSGDSRLRTANLIDDLSLNISFRGRDQIISSEIDSFIKYLLTGEFVPLSNNEIYGLLMSYLSPTFGITNVTDEMEPAVEQISNKIKNLSLVEVMEMTKDDPVYEMEHPPRYQQANIERRKKAKGNTNLMRRIEIESIAKSIVIPILNKKTKSFPLKTQVLITDKIHNLPKSRRYNSVIEHMLHFMPLIRGYVDLLTISGYDINRKDSENDFYDLELMTYGLSYPFIFSAVDKWMKHLMNLAQKEGNLGGSCYAGNLSKLKEKVEKII